MLSVENLNVFREELHVIKDVSFKVEKGIVAILGPNGAGKTTLLEAIIGLLTSYSGNIWFKDRNITNLPISERVAMGLSVVLGRDYLFQEMTVEENLELSAYGRRLKDIKKNLEWIYDIFPRLYELRNKRVKETSGGEQQMLAIGQALIGRPSFLMLDEPSSGLAPKIVAALFDKILDIAQLGTTVLLVEQNVRHTLEISNRVYILVEGKIIFSSSSADLLKDDKIRSFYLGL
jgi:branched-chain amino acid transport system ATP-binding protein